MDKRPDRDLTHFNRVVELSGKEEKRTTKQLAQRVPTSKELPHKAKDQACYYN